MVKKATEATPNRLLRAARKERNWTQKDVADRIGATQSFNVSRWEQGTAFPSAHYIQQLCLLFGKSARELGLLLEEPAVSNDPTAPETDSFPLWNVLYRRNPFFTGREQVLTQLHDRLTASKSAALTQTQAISGLGGIGKTQIAVEYAYRHREDYQAILWSSAASQSALISNFLALAALLHLPEQNEQDQNKVVAAVKRWLASREGWLLILDNADDLDLVVDFLPTGNNGHILLTTRTQATGGIAYSIAVEKMEQSEGARLLLCRAKLLAPGEPIELVTEQERSQARAIVEAMDGLPLALDQAAAYIEETGCGLSGYLELYHTHRQELLRRRSTFFADHPEPVTSTWTLSFIKVEQANSAAADLLRLCAFLDPDAIPEEVLTEGTSPLGPMAADPLQWNETIQVLRRYSLIKRDAEARLLNIHRLVQAVIKDGMDDSVQRRWVERAIRAVSNIFPDPAEFTNWPRCQRYLPQAQNCAAQIMQWHMAFPEAALLLHRVGIYLSKRAQYREAEKLLQAARSLREHAFGSNHPDVAESLYQLATLYDKQRKFDRAEPLLRTALTIREEVLGPSHPGVVFTLNTLGDTLAKQDRYEEAVEILQRALSISEQMSDPNSIALAECLNSLAMLYGQLGKYAESESFYRRSLALAEQIFETNDPNITDIVYNLAALLYKLGNDAEAEPLFLRALANDEQVLGPNHPNVASDLSELGILYTNQGRYGEAEPLYQRAISIEEQVHGPNYFGVATGLNNLALNYARQGRYGEAESLYQRAISIHESLHDADRTHYAISIDNLAFLYRLEKRYDEAESFHLQALAILEQSAYPNQPEIARCLNNLATLYSEQDRDSAAESLYQRALALSEQALDHNHPLVARVCGSYATLLRKMHRDEEATVFEKRAATTGVRRH